MNLTLCINCKHWEGERGLDPDFPLRPPNEEYRVGRCRVMEYELMIDICGEYGGTVASIETVASFGCAFGEPLE